jgi:hypothetical protein
VAGRGRTRRAAIALIDVRAYDFEQMSRHGNRSAPVSLAEAPNFANKSARQLISCRICGRTLLIGERSIGLFSEDGEGPYDVCELCTPRAHRFGLRPHQATAEEVANARSGNALAHLVATMRSVLDGTRTARRRDASASKRRREALEPIQAQGTAAVAAAAATPQPTGPLAGLRKRRAAAAAAANAPMDPMALGAVPVGAAAVPFALAAFNQSPHARTLAGLHRTLGEPRANVQARSTTDREVIVTVAWEIVWYQFRVMPDGIERQSGQYLSELAPRWQAWNCEVHTNGTVHEHPGADSAPGGNDPTTFAFSEEPLPR